MAVIITVAILERHFKGFFCRHSVVDGNNTRKIAIAVYVENAGFGATYGVPIGSLMMEMYLNRKIAPERKYLEERMLQSNTIIYSGVKKH